jgi:hypothetical protein
MLASAAFVKTEGVQPGRRNRLKIANMWECSVPFGQKSNCSSQAVPFGCGGFDCFRFGVQTKLLLSKSSDHGPIPWPDTITRHHSPTPWLDCAENLRDFLIGSNCRLFRDFSGWIERNLASWPTCQAEWDGVPPPKPSSRSPRGRGSRLFKPCSPNNFQRGDGARL